MFSHFFTAPVGDETPTILDTQRLGHGAFVLVLLCVFIFKCLSAVPDVATKAVFFELVFQDAIDLLETNVFFAVETFQLSLRMSILPRNNAGSTHKYSTANVGTLLWLPNNFFADNTNEVSCDLIVCLFWVDTHFSF